MHLELERSAVEVRHAVTLPMMCKIVTKPTKLRLMMMTIVCSSHVAGFRCQNADQI